MKIVLTSMLLFVAMLGNAQINYDTLSKEVHIQGKKMYVQMEIDSGNNSGPGNYFYWEYMEGVGKGETTITLVDYPASDLIQIDMDLWLKYIRISEGLVNPISITLMDHELYIEGIRTTCTGAPTNSLARVNNQLVFCP